MLTSEQNIDALQGLLDITLPPQPETVNHWPVILLVIMALLALVFVWRQRRILKRYWYWRRAWRAFGRHGNEAQLAAQLIRLYRQNRVQSRGHIAVDETVLQRLYAVHYGQQQDQRLNELKPSLRELILYA